MGGVRTEIGPVSTRVVIPILTIPGTVVGGISGATQRKIQEFRDRLTEDLERAVTEQLTNDALASDVFWGLRRLPNLDSRVFALTTPVPEDTDAILHVGFEGITIDIDGKDAVITTTANAVLRRLSDGEHLYEEERCVPGSRCAGCLDAKQQRACGMTTPTTHATISGARSRQGRSIAWNSGTS